MIPAYTWPHTHFFFPQQLNSLPPSFLVGGTSRSIVKLTPHFSFSFSLYYKPIYIPNWLLVSGVPSTFKTNKSIFFFFFFHFIFSIILSTQLIPCVSFGPFCPTAHIYSLALHTHSMASTHTTPHYIFLSIPILFLVVYPFWMCSLSLSLSLGPWWISRTTL